MQRGEVLDRAEKLRRRMVQQRAPTWRCFLLLLAVLALARPAAAFHDGDFIHTSKRSQYQQMRTNWRDLTEHHAPRFGRHRTVALPLLEPHGAEGDVTDYRIQLSFDGDRVVTPWIRVIGGRVVGMPLVRVELRRAGAELKGVRTEVVPLPDDFLVAHADMYDDYANATHWPKHVLVHYQWETAPDVEIEGGLSTILGAGLVVALLVSLNNLAGLQGKLQAFLRDVVGDSASADPLLPPTLTGAAFPGPAAPLYAPGGGGGGGVPAGQRPPAAAPPAGFPGAGGGGYGAPPGDRYGPVAASGGLVGGMTSGLTARGPAPSAAGPAFGGSGAPVPGGGGGSGYYGAPPGPYGPPPGGPPPPPVYRPQPYVKPGGSHAD